MADATQYNPQVGFRIKITKVFQLTPEGVNPATYRLTYTVEGINDLGAMLEVLTSYFLVDYIGTYFTILAVGSGTLDVEDSFRTGECPISNENTIIEKSVGDGLSPFLSSASLQFLHPLAKDNINKWNLDILWRHISNIEPPLVAEYQDFVAGTAKDYVLLLSAIYPFTINSFWAEVDDGSINVSLKIGSTSITGIDGMTIDTSASQIDATALNSVAIGARVIFSLSTTYTGTPTLIRIQIKTTRL